MGLSTLKFPKVLFPLAGFLLALNAFLLPPLDPDIWFHLKIGDWIRLHHALPLHDLFTYTYSGNPWLLHEWLTEVGESALASIGGLPLVLFSFATLGALGMFFLLRRCLLPGEGDRVPSSFAVFIGLSLGILSVTVSLGPRPQLLDFLFLAATVYLIERHFAFNRPRSLWLLPPLFLLWANMHSGFLAGLGVLALFVLMEGFLFWRGSEKALEREKFIALLPPFFVSLLIPLLNPYSFHLYLYPLETFSSSFQQSSIEEWQSPPFGNSILLPFLFFLGTLMLLLFTYRKVKYRDLLFIGVTLLLTLHSVRNLPFFALAATPVWIGNISELRVGLNKFFHKPLPIFTVLLLLPILILNTILLRDSLSQGETTILTSQPVCATDWLAASPGNLKIFNFYSNGGYLLYHLSDKGDQVAVFGDASLAGDSFLNNYLSELTANPSTSKDLLSADVVVLPKGLPLSQIISLDPSFRVGYADANFTSYVPVRTQVIFAKSFTDPGGLCGPVSGKP